MSSWLLYWLYFNALMLLRTKTVNQQKDRSAPVHLVMQVMTSWGVIQSPDITIVSSISPKGHCSSEQDQIILSLFNSKKERKKVMFFIFSFLATFSSSSRKSWLFPLCPVVCCQGYCHTFMQSCILSVARPMNFLLLPSLICSVSVSAASHVYQSLPKHIHHESTQNLSVTPCICRSS